MARKTIISTLLAIALTTPVLAQGAGGAGGAGAATSGTATTGTAAGTGGTNQPANPAAQQTNTNKIVAGEQSTAVQGTKTLPMSNDSGVVSAPGVGVGHAANGVPIGNPGSGLGSPEDSVGKAR